MSSIYLCSDDSYEHIQLLCWIPEKSNKSNLTRIINYTQIIVVLVADFPPTGKNLKINKFRLENALRNLFSTSYLPREAAKYLGKLTIDKYRNFDRSREFWTLELPWNVKKKKQLSYYICYRVMIFLRL